MCLLSPSPCLSFGSGKSRLYYWTPAPVLANHLACVIDLLNVHFTAGNPRPRIFQKADRVVIGNLLAGEKGGGNYRSEMTSTQSGAASLSRFPEPFSRAGQKELAVFPSPLKDSTTIGAKKIKRQESGNICDQTQHEVEV